MSDGPLCKYRSSGIGRHTQWAAQHVFIIVHSKRTTVRSIYNVMRLAFKFGVKWGYITENPMAEKRVELPRGSAKRSKHPVQLTATEFFCLLSRLDLREKLAVAFAGWLGPRISEAFGLQWQDLDLNENVVSFCCLKRHGMCDDRLMQLLTDAELDPMPEVRFATATGEE